jgi:hypothetical protein
MKKARRESEDRGSKGHVHLDIENPETPTKVYGCGHIGEGHVDHNLSLEG